MADGDLISRASLLAAVAELKESPWYNFGKVDGTSPEWVEAMWHYGYLQRKEAVEIIEDMCIKKEPVVKTDDILEQIKDLKKCVQLENSDYLTGYLSALTAIESMLSEPPKGE